MSEIILSIDTSTSNTYVSLKRDDVIFSRQCDAVDSHNEELSILVSAVLQTASVAPKDISKILYGVGPGSFTGLRIGLSFVKGFLVSHPSRARLSTISSLAAAAWSVSQSLVSTYCAAVADARRDEVFGVVHDINTMREVVPLQIYTPSKFRDLVDSLDSNIPISHRGDGDLGLFNQSPSENSLSEALLSLNEAHSAIWVETTADELHKVEPLYIRAVAAKTISERAASAAQKSS